METDVYDVIDDAVNFVIEGWYELASWKVDFRDWLEREDYLGALSVGAARYADDTINLYSFVKSGLNALRLSYGYARRSNGV